MSKVLVTKSKLDALVDAYNTLTSSSGKQTLDALATAISEIQTGGGDPGEDLKLILENPKTGFSITNNATEISGHSFEYKYLKTGSFPNATKVGENAFSNCTLLTSISLPKAESISTQALGYCKSLTEITLESCKTATAGSFRNDVALKTVNLPVCTKLMGAYSFASCEMLENVNIPMITSLGTYCFSGCSALKTLDFQAESVRIMGYCFNNAGLTTLVFSGSTSVAILESASAFWGTPIASGTGNIYVPDALLEDWKAETNWSSYAAQIKPLSELPTS